MKRTKGVKFCIKCGKTKPLSKFNKNPHSKDGKYTYCVNCQHRIHKEYNKQRAKSRPLSDKFNAGHYKFF